jgi:hypothetical protein
VPAVARADVTPVGSGSAAGTGTATAALTVPAGGNRLLAAGVSTTDAVTVASVTYGTQPLTRQLSVGADGAKVEIWTLTAPAVGTADVTVTLSGAAPVVLGATAFTGVDQTLPTLTGATGSSNTAANSASLVLGGTTIADGMFGAISIANAANTSAVFAQGSVDTVVADVRWSTAQGIVRGAGGTRTGNTGQNMALNAGIVWRWSNVNPAELNPFAQALVGLRAATAANNPPTAVAGGPYAVAEGSGVALSAAGSSDPDGDALTYAWDVNGDGTYGDASGAAPTLTGAQLQALGAADGPATRTVRVQVSDAGSTTTSPPTSLTIANVAPSGTLASNGPVAEGGTAQVTFSGVSDPSAADVAAGVRYAYDLDDDGTYEVGGSTYATAVTSATAALPAALTADGPITRTVRAALLDKDGGIRTVTTTVTVTNAAPSGTLAGQTVAEGSAATIGLTGVTDAAADVAAGLRYAYDFDADGTYDVGSTTYATASTATTAALPAALTADGPAVRDVRVAVVDRDGGFSVATAGVTITNVAPTATLTGATVDEGAPATVGFSAPADASAGDAAAGFSYEFDLDGDGTFEATGTDASAVLPAALTADDAVRDVRGAVVDRDGGRTEYEATVAVENVPPTVALEGPVSVPPPGGVALTVRVADAGTDDELTTTLDWGDGTVETVSGGGERAVSHTYAGAADYTVTAVVRDDDGGESAQARHALTVTAPPVEAAAPPASVPLRIGKLTIAPRCIRSGRLRAQAARTVSVSFEMSAAATVRVRMLRRTNKRVLGACPVPRIDPRPGPHVQGIFGPHTERDVPAQAGVNRVRLAATGRRGRVLRPGTYRLTVSAGAVTATRKFWVLPPRSARASAPESGA